jgi:hypothetical protein
MALRCTPCKTEKERVYSGERMRISFAKAGIKTPGLCFALRCFSSQQEPKPDLLGAAARGPAAQGGIILCVYGTTEVVP